MRSAEAQRDQALAQHVLHGLAEPEVDPERERRDELGEPDAVPFGPPAAGHLGDSTPVRARTPWRDAGATRAREACRATDSAGLSGAAVQLDLADARLGHEHAAGRGARSTPTR